jgi:pimeloyl-ACP methyl ester carboxylesterase
MSIVTLDGNLIHYEVLGRGRPLIFLHGWVGSWRYWIPTMQSASISCRTYALDFWGFGDTAKLAERYALDAQVKLVEQFLENLGIGRIALVGHGLGAIVALIFASKHPNVVDRVMATSYPISNAVIHTRLRTATVSDLVDWLLGKGPVTDAARIESPKTDLQAIQNSLDSLNNLNLLELSMHIATPCLFVSGMSDPAINLPPPEIVSLLPEQAHHIIFEQS